MPEVPVAPPVEAVERTPYPREEVIRVFNSEYHDWTMDVRNEIGPLLIRRRPLNPDQQKELDDFRETTEGLRLATGQDEGLPYFYKGNGLFEVRFDQHQEINGQVIPTGAQESVMESFPIEGLIKHLKRKIVERQENKNKAEARGDREGASYWEGRVDEFTERLKILGGEKTYREAHPELTDAQYRDRIRHETHLREDTRNKEQNWLNAEEAMRERRELDLPAEGPRSDRIIPPVTRPTVPTPINEVSSVKPEVTPRVSSTEAISAPYEGIPPVIPSVVTPSEIATPYIGEPTPSFISSIPRPDVAGGIGAIGEALVGEAKRYDLGLRNLIGRLRGSGAEGIARIPGGIRELTEKMAEETRRLDPVVAERVRRLKGIKVPVDPRLVALLPLVAVLLIKGCQGGDEAGVVAPKPYIPPAASMPMEEGPHPQVSPKEPSKSDPNLEAARRAAQEEFANNDPVDMTEFTLGKGWKKLDYSRFDFPNRADYQTKLDMGNPNRMPYYVEGYSIKGATLGQLAKALNPHLKQKVDQLESQGKHLSEGDPEFLQTLDLMKKKIDESFGEGIFDGMVSDFSARMRGVINEVYYDDPKNKPDNFLHHYVIVGDKIVNDKAMRWDISLEDISKWDQLRGASGRVQVAQDPTKWQKISDEIIAQTGNGVNKP